MKQEGMTKEGIITTILFSTYCALVFSFLFLL